MRVAAGDQRERDACETMHPAVYADGVGSIYSALAIVAALAHPAAVIEGRPAR
jgi:hypothetical protein